MLRRASRLSVWWHLKTSDGEFSTSEPVYQDPRVNPGEAHDGAVISAIWKQVEETQHLLVLTTIQNREQEQQIAELQQALHVCELHATKNLRSPEATTGKPKGEG